MLDRPWFKWVIIASSFGLVLFVGGVFIVMEQARQAQEKREYEEKMAKIRELRLDAQTNLTRIYQNLQLKHFLAAYNVLEDFAQPPEILADQVSEYQDVVYRVAEGLLRDRFYDESETLFQRLLNTKDYDEKARDALAEIASSHRLVSARRLLAEAKILVKEKRWRDASNELRKAKLEYESVKLFGFQNVDEELKDLKSSFYESEHHVHLESARWELDDARKFLETGRIDEVQLAMSRAAQHVGRAAFFKRGTKEVLDLRQELLNLEAEIAYRIPNLIPIWNFFPKDEEALKTQYFYMQDYNFDLMENDPSKVRIGFTYSMRTSNSSYYVVRYKIYYFDGSQFFNGHFLTDAQLVAEPTKQNHEIVYEQEIPEKFQKKAVKRIELKIYDENNVLVSKVSRAFRNPDLKGQGV